MATSVLDHAHGTRALPPPPDLPPLPNIELPFLFTPDIGRPQVGVLADALAHGIERL